MPKSEYEVIATRANPTYDVRKEQNLVNLTGYYGGQEYIDLRLTRFAGEAESDFEGDTRNDGSTIIGRKHQAHVVPHLTRIVDKINEYVFGTEPIRDGVDPEFVRDITNDGKSLDDLMIEVNTLITVHGWCWIGIDAPTVNTNEEISQADKEIMGLKPYWTVYSALEVVDWYAIDGKLQWLITEGVDYNGSDPKVEPTAVKYRKLWEPGQVTTYYFKNDSTIDFEEVTPINYPKVPFVLVGQISNKPHGFDNLESINRTILDLESVNRQNFFNCVFPQMYLPLSVLDSVTQKFNVTAEQAVTMIMGYSYPIFLSEGDKEPGYVMPDSSATGSIRTELIDLKKELYDAVGMMLRQETKAAVSAESKAFDHLDVEQVMCNRAKILEDAESKAQKIAKEWDASYPEWEPQYNRDFDISDFALTMEALITASNTPMPVEMHRMILKEIVDIVDQQSQMNDADKKLIVAAIDNYKITEDIKVIEDGINNNTP